MARSFALLVEALVLCVSPKNFLYQNASPCFNFSGDGFASKTRCDAGEIPGAYASWGAPRTGRDSLLYGTIEAQKAIYQHQHPADCRNASFLVVRCPRGYHFTVRGRAD
ncbi:hypothetical protein TSOC_002910 [Tetrabaena socialis]|uniref:Secreted protein n=1 Tax=Tetrabaena socialis TaxID=47790 RepID=A0A2J8ACY9_9CHLO|nr:hypothetical protein TSOC_002910 [Tetrabaena socialis]|eukprot:PNH10381.1 hypothetical protein TSOC_002910 [Tetrabaena socialis]